MSTIDNLKRLIGKTDAINRLKYFRDTGIPNIAANPKVGDFNDDDLPEIVDVINARIIELGGEV